MSEPDFNQLGIESVYTAEVWRQAWGHVRDTPELWPHVLSMVKVGLLGPTTAALMLRKAMLDEVQDIRWSITGP